MSLATSSSPAVAPGMSTSRQQSAERRDTLPRSVSSATRTASTTIPHRSSSTAQAHNPPPSSSRQASNLANVARRDYEQSNLAQVPSAGRNSSMDRRSPEKDLSRQERPRSTQRTASRSNRQQHPADPSTSSGAAGDAQIPPLIRQSTSTAAMPRRRTTVTAQTGEWLLGKTIGAGSMGKVKVARHAQTHEQVSCDAHLLEGMNNHDIVRYQDSTSAIDR